MEEGEAVGDDFDPAVIPLRYRVAVEVRETNMGGDSGAGLAANPGCGAFEGRSSGP